MEYKLKSIEATRMLQNDKINEMVESEKAIKFGKLAKEFNLDIEKDIDEHFRKFRNLDKKKFLEKKNNIEKEVERLRRKEWAK